VFSAYIIEEFGVVITIGARKSKPFHFSKLSLDICDKLLVINFS